MNYEFKLSDGEVFVKTARKSIEYFMHTGQLMKEAPENEAYLKKRGVFVTLSSFPKKGLRGCIGFPEPVMPLWNALIEGAIAAAFRDSRFDRLSAVELEKIVVEVSVLTKPKLIKVKRADQYLKKIEIGRDGLVIKKSGAAGLLLPQVAPEWNWDSKQFLEECCMKAGLEKDSWKEEGTAVYSFQAQIFKEETPRGKVVEKED